MKTIKSILMFVGSVLWIFIAIPIIPFIGGIVLVIGITAAVLWYVVMFPVALSVYLLKKVL